MQAGEWARAIGSRRYAGVTKSVEQKAKKRREGERREKKQQVKHAWV